MWDVQAHLGSLRTRQQRGMCSIAICTAPLIALPPVAIRQQNTINDRHIDASKDLLSNASAKGNYKGEGALPWQGLAQRPLAHSKAASLLHAAGVRLWRQWERYEVPVHHQLHDALRNIPTMSGMLALNAV